VSEVIWDLNIVGMDPDRQIEAFERLAAALPTAALPTAAVPS
jgi:hypothetical protein